MLTGVTTRAEAATSAIVPTPAVENLAELAAIDTDTLLNRAPQRRPCDNGPEGDGRQRSVSRMVRIYLCAGSKTRWIVAGEIG